MLLLENKCKRVTDKKGNTPLIDAACKNRYLAATRMVPWLKIPNKEGAAAEVAGDGQHALAEYLTNQVSREQVRLASCARDAITPERNCAYYPICFVF